MTSNMLNITAIFANMKLKQTQQRLNSGRKKYIAEGWRLGRNEGSTETPDQVLEKHKEVVKQLRKGLSIRNVRDITGKSTATMQKVKQLLAA